MPRSLAGIVAVSCVALINVVVRAEPFHRTPEPETKLLPLTIKVNAGPPTDALLGESELSTGAELDEEVSCMILATDGTPLPFRMNSI